MSGRIIRVISLLIVSCTFMGLHALPALSFTIWGAAGDKAAGNGTILAANTDGIQVPNEIKLIVPRAGFTYLGLFPANGSKKGEFIAGVNEKGLSVVSIPVAGSARTVRSVEEEGLREKMLTSYGSVDPLLKNKAIFLKIRPSFYMIADSTKIALIEVAPRKEIAIKMADKDVLWHTDHYLDEKLLWANKNISVSSEERLSRISRLLTDQISLSFTLDDFVAFSEDRQKGPDNSIWRTGSAPDKERTLASWVVRLPKDEPPELYIKLANPGEPEKTYNLLLDRPFWTEGIK